MGRCGRGANRSDADLGGMMEWISRQIENFVLLLLRQCELLLGSVSAPAFLLAPVPQLWGGSMDVRMDVLGPNSGVLPPHATACYLSSAVAFCVGDSELPQCQADSSPLSPPGPHFWRQVCSHFVASPGCLSVSRVSINFNCSFV